MAMTLSLLWTTVVELMPALNSGTRQMGSPVRAFAQKTLPSPVAVMKTRLPLNQVITGCEKELSLGRSPDQLAQTSSPVFLSKA